MSSSKTSKYIIIIHDVYVFKECIIIYILCSVVNSLLSEHPKMRFSKLLFLQKPHGIAGLALVVNACINSHLRYEHLLSTRACPRLLAFFGIENISMKYFLKKISFGYLRNKSPAIAAPNHQIHQTLPVLAPHLTRRQNAQSG